MSKNSANSFRDFFSCWRQDLPAGVVVFLVALPLCLGIALASDAPLLSGVVAGVVGGLVVSLFSGSAVSVSGPAAGLTVIVAGAIKSLGSFELFLCAVLISGFIQLILSRVKAGDLVNVFPSSVINGMLAAIGITIILKQIPHALGGTPQFESDMAFWNWLGHSNALKEIVGSVLSLNPTALLISVSSLALLVFWESSWVKSRKKLAMIPGPLLAVSLGVLVNSIFHIGVFPDYALHSEDGHLVKLPEVTSLAALWKELSFPNLSGFSMGKVWATGLVLAAVASVETLLSIESSDKLDPQRRISDSNKELRAQGIGNIVSSLLGGLPMTSVIVRSSANVYAGARSRLSSFFHGFILLTTVLIIPNMLNLIPLACLAAVLLAVGYKLSHPKLYKKIYADGMDQFIPFIATILAILATDLLKGVLIGLCIGIVFVIRASYYSAITVVKSNTDFLIRFTKDVTFIHKAKLKRVLQNIPEDSRVFVDGSRSTFIDHDIYVLFADFQETCRRKNITVEFREVENKEFRSLISRNKTNAIIQEATAQQSSVG